MAFPIIPVAVIAFFAAMAGGGKRRRKAPPLPPVNGTVEEEEVEIDFHTLTLAAFAEGGVVELNVIAGDWIIFDFTAAPPGDAGIWKMYTEIVEGAPVVAVSEEIVPPGTDAAPNTPARYLGEIETLEGPGTIEVTIDWGEDPELVPNAVVMATKTARIHIV